MANKKSQSDFLVLIPGIDNQPWHTSAPPDIVAASRLDRDGGARKPDVLTSPPDGVPTFTATRPYKRGRDWPQIRRVQQAALTGNCPRTPVSITALDGNKVPDDTPMQYMAVVLGMQGPPTDSNAANANAMVQVTLGIESVA